jgi:hypothetical protein
MTPIAPPRPHFLKRRLGAVPWYHDGCNGLSVRAGADVPAFDDQMIRGALARGALACTRIEGLDRALNRELWPIGYVARLETDQSDRPIVLVEAASGR